MPKALDKGKLDDMSVSSYVSDKDLKGLSWEEMKYLQDRGKLTQAQQRKHGFTPNRGTGGSYPPGQEPADEFAEEDELEEAEEEEEPQTGSNPQEEDEASTYDGWTKDELKAEIRVRNEMRDPEDQIKLTGKQEELAQRLADDDAADDEEEEEEA